MEYRSISGLRGTILVATSLRLVGIAAPGSGIRRLTQNGDPIMVTGLTVEGGLNTIPGFQESVDNWGF